MFFFSITFFSSALISLSLLQTLLLQVNKYARNVRNDLMLSFSIGYAIIFMTHGRVIPDVGADLLV